MNSIINELHPDSYRRLYELYNADEVMGTESNEPMRIDKSTLITPEQGELLRILCRKFNAVNTLEIGFAYGFSTVWILDALRFQPNSSHIAIDPFQRVMWGGVGIASTNSLNYKKNFQWIEDYSILALSNFIKQGKSFDLIFIDGNHRFDDVMVDFYLSDLVLEIGGLLIFDDMWLPSIRRVIDFIKTNRSYVIIRTSVENMAVFKKIAKDSRNWDHFIQF